MRKSVNTNYEDNLEVLKAMNIKIEYIDDSDSETDPSYQGEVTVLNYNDRKMYLNTNYSADSTYQYDVIYENDFYHLYNYANNKIEKRGREYVNSEVDEFENYLKMLAMINAYEQKNLVSVYDGGSKNIDELYYQYDVEMTSRDYTRDEFLESRENFRDPLIKITVIRIGDNKVRIETEEEYIDDEGPEIYYGTSVYVTEVTFDYSQWEFDKEYNHIVDIIEESDDIIDIEDPNTE